MISADKNTRDKIWIIIFLVICFTIVGWKITSVVSPIKSFIIVQAIDPADIGSDEHLEGLGFDSGAYTPSEQGQSEEEKLKQTREEREREIKEKCEEAMEEYAGDVDDGDSSAGKFVPVKETDGPLMKLTRQNTLTSLENKGLLMEICIHSHHLRAIQEEIEWLEMVTKPEAVRQNLEAYDKYKEELYELINEHKKDSSDPDSNETETLFVDDYEEYMNEGVRVAIAKIMNALEKSGSEYYDEVKNYFQETLTEDYYSSLADIFKCDNSKYDSGDIDKYLSGDWEDFDQEDINGIKELIKNNQACTRRGLENILTKAIAEEMSSQLLIRNNQYVASGGYRNPCEKIEWEGEEFCDRTKSPRPVSAPRDALAASMPQDPRPMAGSAGVETSQPSASQTVDLEMPEEGTEQRPGYLGPGDSRTPSPGTISDLPNIDTVSGVLNDNFDLGNLDINLPPGVSLGDINANDLLGLLNNLGLSAESGQSPREIRENNQDKPPVIIKFKKVENIPTTGASDYEPDKLGTIMWWSPNARSCYTVNNWYQSSPVLGDIELIRRGRSGGKITEGKSISTTGIQQILLPLHIYPNIMLELFTALGATADVPTDFSDAYENPDNIYLTPNREVTLGSEEFTQKWEFTIDQIFLNRIQEEYDRYEVDGVVLNMNISFARDRSTQGDDFVRITESKPLIRNSDIDRIANNLKTQLSRAYANARSTSEIKKYHFERLENETDDSGNTTKAIFHVESKAEYKIKCTNNSGTTEEIFEF